MEPVDQGMTALRIEAARARAAQVAERIVQIRARVGELRESSARARVWWQAAFDRVEVARAHAEEAASYSVHAYLAAATAHDRVAEYHETADRDEKGDVETHRRKAAHHREMAERDRRSASAVRPVEESQ
jgi:hypothetical protein